MTPHLVADEIRGAGWSACICCPGTTTTASARSRPGIDPSWAEHIGKPLTSVPAPPGSTYPSWAEHFKAPMVRALAELGIEVRGISQTAQYTSAAYREQILLAMRERARIDEILGRAGRFRRPPERFGLGKIRRDGRSRSLRHFPSVRSRWLG